VTLAKAKENLDTKNTLPHGWNWVLLEDLFDVKQGAAMSPVRRQGIAPHPFLRTLNVLWGSVDLSNLDKMDFAENEVASLNLRSGDLLVCEGGDVGRTAIWKGELDSCLYQNHIHRLRRRHNNVAPEFYAYWMQAAYKVFQSYTGKEITTTIPNLSGSKLKSFMVPLPPTLAEQERIAHILNAQMTAVEKARAAAEARLEAAKALPAAYLRVAFESEEAKGWQRVKCADFVDVRDGTHDTPEYVPNGIPLVTSKNLKPHGIDFDNVLMISHEDYEQIKKRSGVDPGDILFAMIGTIGNPVIVDTEREFSIKNVALFKFDNSPLEAEFFYFVLQSPDIMEQIRVATQGGIQKFVSLAVLRNLYIPVPSVTEQRVFIAKLREKLSMTDILIQNNKEQLQSINALPAALLRRAFTGGL